MNIRYSLQQKDIFACQTGNLNLREKKKTPFPPKNIFLRISQKQNFAVQRQNGRKEKTKDLYASPVCC